jgi:hypothetical protein
VPPDQTVAATWAWMTGPTPAAPPAASLLGLDPVKEQAALTEWRTRRHPETATTERSDLKPSQLK